MSDTTQDARPGTPLTDDEVMWMADQHEEFVDWDLVLSLDARQLRVFLDAMWVSYGCQTTDCTPNGTKILGSFGSSGRWDDVVRAPALVFADRVQQVAGRLGIESHQEFGCNGVSVVLAAER